MCTIANQSDSNGEKDSDFQISLCCEYDSHVTRLYVSHMQTAELM